VASVASVASAAGVAETAKAVQDLVTLSEQLTRAISLFKIDSQ
jgi:hypothetical protein